MLVEPPGDDPRMGGGGEVKSLEGNPAEGGRTGDRSTGGRSTSDGPGECGRAADPQQQLAIHATPISLEAISADPPKMPCETHTMFYCDSYHELLEILLKLVQDEGLAVYNAEKPAVREQGKHSRGSIITG